MCNRLEMDYMHGKSDGKVVDFLSATSIGDKHDDLFEGWYAIEKLYFSAVSLLRDILFLKSFPY